MVSQWQIWVQDPGLPIPKAVLFPNSKEELVFTEGQLRAQHSILFNPLPQKRSIKFASIL